MPSTPRPFRVLGLQQIAVGAADKGALRSLWIDLLGWKITVIFAASGKTSTRTSPSPGWVIFGSKSISCSPSIPRAGPRVDQPALNHVGLWIDDLPAAQKWLAEQGVRFTPGGIRKGASGFDICFIHPKGNEVSPIGGQGVLIELVQAPPELVSAFDRLASAPSSL